MPDDSEDCPTIDFTLMVKAHKISDLDLQCRCTWLSSLQQSSLFLSYAVVSQGVAWKNSTRGH